MLLLYSLPCTTEGQRLINEGASPAYGQGFDDGCSSGKKSAGDMFSQFHKNVLQFQYNQQYMPQLSPKEIEELNRLGH